MRVSRSPQRHPSTERSAASNHRDGSEPVGSRVPPRNRYHAAARRRRGSPKDRPRWCREIDNEIDLASSETDRVGQSRALARRPGQSMRPRKSGDYRCAGCAPIPRDRRSCPHRAVGGSSRSRPSCRAVARGEVDALHRCCPPARRELDRRAGARQVEPSELTGLRTGGSLTRRSIHQRFANFDQTKLRDLTPGVPRHAARGCWHSSRAPTPG